MECGVVIRSVMPDRACVCGASVASAARVSNLRCARLAGGAADGIATALRPMAQACGDRSACVDACVVCRQTPIVELLIKIVVLRTSS